MHFSYETDRLELKVLNDKYAVDTLRFYSEGAEVFNQVEPDKPYNFYTRDYQEALLRGEYDGFLNGSYMRYYVFLAKEPDRIIGTVSFADIRKGAYRSCILGYKFLPAYHKHGYATEAISRLITALFEEEHMHRIEAYTLASNTASIGVLLRIGFQQEGIARSIICLRNGFCDHNRYALINPLD